MTESRGMAGKPKRDDCQAQGNGKDGGFEILHVFGDGVGGNDPILHRKPGLNNQRPLFVDYEPGESNQGQNGDQRSNAAAPSRPVRSKTANGNPQVKTEEVPSGDIMIDIASHLEHATK